MAAGPWGLSLDVAGTLPREPRSPGPGAGVGATGRRPNPPPASSRRLQNYGCPGVPSRSELTGGGRGLPTGVLHGPQGDADEPGSRGPGGRTCAWEPVLLPRASIPSVSEKQLTPRRAWFWGSLTFSTTENVTLP